LDLAPKRPNIKAQGRGAHPGNRILPIMLGVSIARADRLDQSLHSVKSSPYFLKKQVVGLNHATDRARLQIIEGRRSPMGRRLTVSPSETVVRHRRGAARHADDDSSYPPTSHEPLPTFPCPSMAPWPAGAPGSVHWCTDAGKDAQIVRRNPAPATPYKLPNWIRMSFRRSEIESDQCISEEPRSLAGLPPSFVRR
jgi:hypothetical protein